LTSLCNQTDISPQARVTPATINSAWRPAEILGHAIIVSAFFAMSLYWLYQADESIVTPDTSVFEQESMQTILSREFFVARRCPTPLFIFKAASNNHQVIAAIHMVLHVASWSLLAVVVASLFGDVITRLAATTAVCAFAASEAIAGWTMTMLSESSTFSFAAMFTALTILLIRSASAGRGFWYVFVPWMLSACFFAGTRDTMNYSLLTVLAMLLVLMCLMYVFKKETVRHFAVASVSLFAVIAAGLWLTEQSPRWHTQLLNVFCQRILPDPSVRAVWHDRYAMPDNPVFLAHAEKWAYEPNQEGWQFRWRLVEPINEREVTELADVRHWYLNDAMPSYKHYLIVNAIPASIDAARASVDLMSFRGAGYRKEPFAEWHRLFSKLTFPTLTPPRLLAVLIVELLILLTLFWSRWDRRIIAITALFIQLNAWVQIFISYHGDANEVTRHTFLGLILFRLGVLLLLLLFLSAAIESAAAFVSKRRHAEAVMTNC